MANPAEDDRGGAEATKRTHGFWRWFDRPTPRWFPLVVGALLLAGYGAWLLFGAGDQLPKRWKPPNLIRDFETSKTSDLYARLLPPQSAPANPCDIAHRCASPKPDWNRPHVSVYSIKAAPRALATLRDLSDLGQAEAIKFLQMNGALKGNAWADLQDSLNDTGAPGAGEKDPVRFDRVVVATVTKGASWDPGDRMMWTRVFIEPINFSFAGYTVANTDNETLKVASVEATNSRKFSADIGLTIPGLEGPKAGLSPSVGRDVKTTSEINAQYERLGIDITPNFLRIIRESETGGDVAGNTTVSLTAVTDAQTIRKQFPNDDARHDTGADDVILLVTGTHFEGDSATSGGAGQQTPTIDVLPQVPVPHCSLKARVWMLYEWREVESGRESYDESKQTVTLQRDAEDKADVEIMSADEVSPAIWSLRKCAQAKCGGEGDALTATVKDGDRYRRVVFTDYGVAVKLAHWLRTNKQSTPAGSNYTFNYDAESKESLIPVKTMRDECTPKQEGDAAAVKPPDSP